MGSLAQRPLWARGKRGSGGHEARFWRGLSEARTGFQGPGLLPTHSEKVAGIGIVGRRADHWGLP